MPPTVATTVVDRPAAEVFAYTTDPARFHEWQQGVIDGHLDQAGPAQVGTKYMTGVDGNGLTPPPRWASVLAFVRFRC